ncbi:methylated-DNA--[protein]-cysteine S-methyltransferase [Thermosyntropha sp.]|uniref:methylated-DNA--[protein]-cysteine S-methyltransferase n=1 Tax=Thermosyntropha sp. TaxID=2740820 RepID=UPI0025D28B20|nr:methylated-DNA--[protein]-cysteine S-methyltransferase [Thermosyntropha sp.]MBO8158438.1 methylated-DNA--[protein]-cysteine S-methyltransferase [Thermosyntropha sp.]
MKNIAFYYSPIGRLAITTDGSALTKLYFPDEIIPEDVTYRETDLLSETIHQLDEYFMGKRKYFTLPLKPEGSSFMQEVWEYLLQISYGEIKTYAEIAQKIKRPNAYRAVALACSRNPLPILIPCHRVIRKNGSLSGYRGGEKFKRYLIALELQYK